MLLDPKATVNAFTEWGILDEVIVGSVKNGYLPKDPQKADISYFLFYIENLVENYGLQSLSLQNASRAFSADNVAVFDEREIAERAEDVSVLCETLRGLGITVRNVSPLDDVAEIRTPYWQSLDHYCHNVRDQVLIIGDTIIETPPLCRNRYFETDRLKSLFYEYFAQGAKWISAPRPTMREQSFDKSFAQRLLKQPLEERIDGLEIMFDAAQCLRFGADVLFNVTTANHRLGAQWLERQLAPHIRVHVIENFADNHIDGVMMPLRPGTLLINPAKMHNSLSVLPEALQKWDMIACPDVDTSVYDNGNFLPASEFISANVLPLGDDRVVVEERNGGLIKALEQKGFTPVPVRLRHSRRFSGGFHCITLDVRRQEVLESYFD